MKNTVFLNSAKVDFDRKLNFKPLTQVTNLIKYDASSTEEILERITDQNIIITKELPVGRDLIAQFPPSVKLICEAGTGYNNIDIKAAREKNITVCNIPAYSAEAVAQLAITFILSLSSTMVVQQNMLKQKNYNNFTTYLQVPHFELLGKTLGVIGSGSIGSHVIKTARSLGMNIIVYSRTAKIWKDTNIRSVSLEELLKQSDFITIHCPLTPETKHLINKERLKLMKPSAFIINTSRGAIIKEMDLIEALQNKTIAGAALDVQDPEPPELDNPMFTMENVILTPHIGWKCIESRQRLIELLAANIKAFSEGNPINVVS
jgi:Lactate dehydrogenase and related dehydrogenases